MPLPFIKINSNELCSNVTRNTFYAALCAVANFFPSTSSHLCCYLSTNKKVSSPGRTQKRRRDEC